MSTAVDHWRAFGLLVRGCLSREHLLAPFRTIGRQFLLPVGVVGFFTFVGADAAVQGGWPMIAVAGAVWMLFANTVTQAGMVLWNERRLLRGGTIPAVTLLAAATPGPLGLFVAHLFLIYLLVPAGQTLQVRAVVLGGVIAAAAGLGAGILAARLCALRPRFSPLLPMALLFSLILTPVFYLAGSLERIGQLWCTVNPLCAAVELGRAALSAHVTPPSPQARNIACAVSAAILVSALFTLRERVSVFRGDRG